MSTAPFFGGAFLALLAVSMSPAPSAAPVAAALVPGTLPAQWNAGNNCGIEPEFQVHAYNSDFFIIRQSKCTTAEAPFVFLFMGNERALLMDTGAVASSNLKSVVDRLIARWSAQHGVSHLPLVVGHTHSHGDHVAGDNQFKNQPGVQAVAGTSTSAVQQFWGFQNWPVDQPTIDLGGRILDVLAIPGHQSASIALYDRQTGVLLTGDSIYPGHLFVPSLSAWTEFKDSTRRLVEFAAANPVSYVLGNHIEFSSTPFGPYPWATAVHPDERKLEFGPNILRRVLIEAELMGNDPQCQVFADFVIHPTFKCNGKWNG
jgi:hydroxyacylglutathione hydrolase